MSNPCRRPSSSWLARAVRRALTTICLPALVAVSFSDASAQSPAESPTVAEAARRRDAGDYAAAVELLRARLERHPDDGDAARMLAETIYWTKDFRGARSAYEWALERHPEDVTLRLLYGRMLLETGDPRRARDVVEPATAVADARGRAESLLGTMDYWSGDYTRARRHFVAALDADPSLDDARRQLGEIDAISAPWTTLESTVRHDDQPIDGFVASGEVGWHPTPLSAVSGRVESRRLRSDDGIEADVLGGELRVAHYAAASRLDLEARAGALQRSGGAGTEWSGRAGVGLRLGAGWTVRARAERSAYLYTVASLDSSVMTTSIDGALEWRSRAGWEGQAGAEHQAFADDNAINSAYAWLLAPLVKNSDAELRVGYGLSMRDARDSRFVAPSANVPNLPPSGGSAVVPGGRYDPYYTPSQLVAHDAIVAAVVHPAPAVAMRLGGSYAVRATDLAPVRYARASAGGPPLLFTQHYRRTLHPYTARGALEVRASSAVSLAATFERSHTPFYTASAFGARLTWTFLRASPTVAAR